MNLTAVQYNDTVEWLRHHSIYNFYIRPDGKVDVRGNVTVYPNGSCVLGVQFGTIYGSFDVSETSLSSFKNFPETIHGDLDCHRTHILSFSGIDRVVSSVAGNIRVSHYATHLLGLLLVDGVTQLNTGDFNRDTIMNKYIRTHDIVGAQDELIDAGYLSSARL